MAYRYKEAMKTHKRTAFQRRDVKSEITIFRIVEQKGACVSFIPRYKTKPTSTDS